MNRLTFILLLAVLPAACADGEWISLFNGKDFTGWKVGGDQNTFQIKDGALVANGQVAHAYYDGPVNNYDFSFLNQCRKPILFVQGDVDEYGDVERLRELVETIPAPTELKVIKGAGHFFDDQLDELKAAIAEWIVSAPLG